MTLCGPLRQPEEDGGIAQGEPREEAQVHQSGGVGILLGKLDERVVQRDQLFVIGVQGDFDLVKVDAVAFTPSFGTLLVACAIEKNPPHRFSRRRKEMAPTVPALNFGRVDQPEIRVVDQGGGLERLPGLLLRQPEGGQLAQLVVDQRQELLGGARVALLDRRQDAGNIAQRVTPPWDLSCEQTAKRLFFTDEPKQCKDLRQRTRSHCDRSALKLCVMKRTSVDQNCGLWYRCRIMAWKVVVRESVIHDLRWFGRKDGRLLLAAAEERLAADPVGETKNLKTLRPNPVAQRELRLVGKYGVVFNVDVKAEVVTIILVGEKRGDALIVQGEEFRAHDEDYSPE